MHEWLFCLFYKIIFIDRAEIDYEKILIVLLLFICSFYYIGCSHDKEDNLPIDEFNNDVFTEELYKDITKMTYVSLNETVYSKEDKTSIHDAYKILAALSLAECDNITNEAGNFMFFQIWVSDKKYNIAIIGNDLINFEGTQYIFSQDIIEPLKEIFIGSK